MIIKFIWAKILKKIRGSAIKGSVIHPTSKIESGCNIVNVHMGRHSFCGYDCEIINAEIGSFCSIANNVIIGGGMHPIKWVSTSPVFYEGKDSVKMKYSLHKRESQKKTRIGHDVWIGQCALLKQGISVGTGAVIGMGSIVTKDVEPYTVVAGNPARLIKKRFNEEIIKELLETQWWLFDEELLLKSAKYFTNPKEFLSKHKI